MENVSLEKANSEVLLHLIQKIYRNVSFFIV